MNYIWPIAVLVIGLPIVWLKFQDQFGAGVLVLVGIFVLGDSVGKQRDMKALASYGQVAQAEAVGDNYTTITKVRSGYKTFKARIAFQTAGGQLFTEEAAIPEAVLNRFKAGQKVAVTYLPGKPAVYQFNPLPPASNDDLLLALGMIAAGGLWIGFKRLTAGEPAEA